jgi:hypothetical protein
MQAQNAFIPAERSRFTIWRMSGTPYDETAVDTKGPESHGDGAWKAPERYEVREVLGRGGMGEVTLAFDTQIGRGVAIKRMRGSEPSEIAVTRFLRRVARTDEERDLHARRRHPGRRPPRHARIHGAPSRCAARTG